MADLDQVPLISNSRTPGIEQLIVQEGWTLVSCSGTIGNTAYVRPEMSGMAASQHVMRAIPHEGEVSPGYLFAFLTSAPGQLLLKRRTYGSIVQHIEPHHIADLPVPLPPSDFQDCIHHLVTSAAQARTKASRLLNGASAYFDALAGPMPSPHDHAFAMGVVRRTVLNMRLDAFHQIGWALEPRALPGVPLGDLASVTRPPIVPRIPAQGGVPFVSGIDVYQVRPSYRQTIRRDDAERAGCLISAGQILVQRGGQRYGLLGHPALVGNRLNGWAASEDLLRITMHDPSRGGHVFSFLRSGAGHRGLVRHSYGTSIPKLNVEGLASLVIPELAPALAADANQALALRERADADEQRAIDEVEAWLG